ncbi:DNA-binding protein [Sphingobium yanoikuyae]|uniref:DNA-binding protein n=1 Tax=Sphingobium yanoikuyae TaxID=13690 RepID=A0AA42WUN8_SPHYA|nr:DNA-binding protein [Sphingobium yanoikuyae]MDH2131920.1 DNA-binding protein [Sphingobium yanoikuyae]MDH2150151.1 DNA-binding protein [Sphingobium yanoikuyae]MDH2167592.1 DNA-binding protein [Sphingobium yanoikuyae]
MKVAALRFHNVKRFAGRGVAIEGIGDGVNVLCAANEFGKSTSFEALHGLFFQPHSSTAGGVRALRPYSGGNPLIEADIVVDDAHYRITKQYYAGKFAKVVDLASGRLIAQADEAENFIGKLIHGGAGGPAGLLWVRQGLTGIEPRNKKDEDNDLQVRTSLLESVQGEVEAMTGGRRMAEIMAATGEAAGELVTATGRPKAGGRYAAAIDLRDRLAAEEQRLAGEVTNLREALDQRGTSQRRLAELESPDARDARKQAVDAAEVAFDAARAQAERLKAAQAELDLAREQRDTALRDHRQFEEALAEARQLAEDSREANRRRDEAVERRRLTGETIADAQAEIEAAEADEKAARELLAILDAAIKARDAAERRAEWEERLQGAEAVRGTIETSEAQLAGIRLPDGAVDELADLDIEIARIRAVQDAARPTVTVAYDSPVGARVTMGDTTLGDGEERGYNSRAQLIAPGIGTITLRSNAADDDGRLAAAEAQRRTLLASMGVSDLAAARAQQVHAQSVEAQANEAKAQLKIIAPDGLEALRETVAALAGVDTSPVELKADPDETRAARDVAEQRRREAAQTIRTAEPARAQADEAFIKAETVLARLQTRDEQVVAILGPVDEREAKGQGLAARLAKRDAALADAQRNFEERSAEALDLDAADATLRRVRSVEQAAATEIQQLRETIAGLNARITARSDEAVEEAWRETADALSAAEARVSAFEREVAVLTRLTQALEAARSGARDLYLKPVMSELRPLLGLLFDDVTITFDDRTLLPQTIVRAGLQEDVDRLSGGMREQLSVLTRLAFARLLARDGRPAPVILDDALVYSDDDRIERMFDALHRQAREQQVIVFSCRQRAFQSLGGNVLQMTDWQP